jgi:hypothetical protein
VGTWLSEGEARLSEAVAWPSEDEAWLIEG